MGCNVQFWASTDTYSHQLGSILDEAMCIRECTRQPIKMCEVQSLVLSGLHVVDVVCPCRCSKGEKPYATCSGREHVLKQPSERRATALAECRLDNCKHSKLGSAFPCCC